jgi:type IV pilus secretin PilQ/predicted competence protein
MIANSTRHDTGSSNTRPRLAAVARFALALLVVGAGGWAAGLTAATPVGAFWPAGGEAVTLGSHLKTISAKAGRRVTTVAIELSDPAAYLANQPDPMTVLVDLRNVTSAGVANAVSDVKGLVAGVSVEDAVAADGAALARVHIRLAQPAAYRVRSNRSVIYVDFDGTVPLTMQPAARDSAGAPIVPVLTPGRAATTLESVRARAEPTGTSVTLVGNGELVVDAVVPVSEGSPKVVLDFPNVRSKAPPEVLVGRGPVDRVHVTTSGSNPLTRVVVDLLRPATYRVLPAEDGAREFTVIFEEDRASAAPDAPVFAASLRGPAVNGADAADPIAALMAPSPSASPDRAAAAAVARAGGSASPQQAAAAPQQSGTAPARTAGQDIGGSRRSFTGHPVSLDFQGADLRAVLRTFAEISGLNIVIDPSVQGSVDVALRDVPWDQALDIILRANKLGYIIDGTIVRIAPLNVLADEEGQRRKLADEQALSGELQVLTRPLSYAKAEELTPLLTRTALSSRGDIQVDARTNTIIIRDLAVKLQTASDLINTLDRAQPQVEIEARIVQTSRNFARNLGVQWGFNGRVASDLGNTTGLAFPNQGTLTGRTGGIQGPIQGEITDHAATAIDLGVSPATSAIGLALGSVNGALNLDVALSALESSGNGRILSTPRVVTQNNVAAEMTQGVQIPIQTVANNTVTVTFKDAALTLKVTPQITAANTVIMQISLENASPDFSRAINNIPPIDTQRALTSVLVSDGQTTVIGGIYISQQQATRDRTPGLYRLPLIGWLFQRRTETDQNRELLIFITPRIIKT